LLQCACGDLWYMKAVLVLYDEARHFYSERIDSSDADIAQGENKQEAKENNEAARLWINGIAALKRKVTRRWIAECLCLKGGTKTGMLTYLQIADMAAELIYAALIPP